MRLLATTRTAVLASLSAAACSGPRASLQPMGPLLIEQDASVAAVSHRHGPFLGVRDAGSRWQDAMITAGELTLSVLDDPRFRARVAALDGAMLRVETCGAHTTDVETVQSIDARLRAARNTGFGLACHDRVDSARSRNTHAWEGGHCSPGPRWIELNCGHFATRDPSRWSGTVVHELAHVGGYLHQGNVRSIEGADAVPYVLGDLAEWTAAQIVAERAHAVWDARSWHPESPPGRSFCAVWQRETGLDCPPGR